MAFLPVQTSATQNSNSATHVVTLSPTGVGNLVVVHLQFSSTISVASIIDDQGNTYVVSAVYVPAGGAACCCQAYGVQATGGATTITITLSATMTTRAAAEEFSGNAASNAATFDAQTTGKGGTFVTSVHAGTLTPAATGELMVSTLVCSLGAATWTAGSGYTLSVGSNPDFLRSQYKLSSGSSETGPATVSSSNYYLGTILTAFMPLPAVTAVPNLLLLGVG